MKFWWCFAFLGCFLAMDLKNETPCITPNGEKAVCKLLQLCPILKKAFSIEEEITQKFILASTTSCAGGGLIVCCGTSDNYTTDITTDISTTTESHRENVLKNLLPDKRYCGMQHIDDYVHDITQISVDEFPWMVLVYNNDKKQSADPINPSLKYQYYGSRLMNGDLRYLPVVPSKVTNQCTGVLISGQYVLTSSQCAMYKSMQVVLGQHNSKKNESCVTSPYGDDCADPPITITVEKQFLSPNGHFVLLRLAEEVSFTDFIRPICLPMDESVRPKLYNSIITSGWESYGRANRVVIGAKKRIEYNMVTNYECGLSDTPEYMCCEIVQEPTFICKVDNGGPMMYRYKTKNWYVEGIVHVDHCFHSYINGYRITPEVVDWILENMEP